MTSSTPSSSSTGLPGVDGTCGHQHNNALCLHGQGTGGTLCCSVNGYCGSDDTYCLVSNGCQSGCHNESDFSSTSLTISSSRSISSTISLHSSTILTSSPTSSPTSSLTSSATHSVTSSSTIATHSATNSTSHHLSKGEKAGAIAGGTLGGIALIFILLILWRSCCGGRHREIPYNTGATTTPANRVRHED